jgi:amino acid transporter
MLIVLLGVFGMTGFHILMPLTAVVLGLLLLTTLCYREVVTVYTRAGGSYVVARENFGPKVAQMASVALLIDYIVTVAVQAAAGTAAITSLVPALSNYTMEITVGVVLLLAYGNLRGVREAGKAFAFPTYFFVTMAGSVVVVGLVRELLGDLPVQLHQEGMIAVTDKHHAILSGMAIFVLLKAFANGGASLTGLEAISNSVSAFKRPEGINARKTLSVMSVLLGALVLGISFLAWRTHATPYEKGTPTVISQVAKDAFGTAWYGHIGFVLVQVATALILYTGANTPFTGFPFLASFIAEDSFLPRQMTRRGHRLAFSNGIIVLTVAALALLLGVGAHADKLIAFYAIGVFTGFTMAGLGMSKYYRTHRPAGWRRKLRRRAGRCRLRRIDSEWDDADRLGEVEATGRRRGTGQGRAGRNGCREIPRSAGIRQHRRGSTAVLRTHRDIGHRARRAGSRLRSGRRIQGAPGAGESALLGDAGVVRPAELGIDLRL